MNDGPVILLMGPTAGGKTETVFALAERLPIEVISVDAAQIYRGLDIGTAKPSRAQRRELAHALIDIRDVGESYSAARFRSDALKAIAASIRRERIPVLCGGSSFYFHALERGLPEGPGADPGVRAELARRLTRDGLAALYGELSRRDPRRAQAIAPTDPQRILRALEIVALHGQVPPPDGAYRFPWPVIKFALCPASRADLHARIAARFRRMLVRGLIEEGRWLYGRGLADSSPALRLVGYRQVGEYLRGEIQYTGLVERGVAATRQLAKRQLTWLRADSGVTWLDSEAQTAKACAGIIAEAVHRVRAERAIDVSRK